MKMRLVAVSLAACFLAGAHPGGAQARDLAFGGASTAGVYYQVARHLCHLWGMEESAYRCEALVTQGSVYNINALAAAELDFAVAQSDRAWQARHGEADWDGSPVEGLRALFAMHPETVMLVTRQDTDIHTLDDLRGRTVNIGNPGSGQRRNALDVLRLHGIDPEEDIAARHVEQTDASRALVAGRLDAFFYTVGNPSAAILDPAAETPLRMIPLDSGEVAAFVEESPFYVPSVIPGGIYAGVPDDVATFAVTANVVTTADMDADAAYALTRVAFERLDELRAGHEAFARLEPEAMVTGVSIELHPGARRYYEERGLLEPGQE